LTTPITRHLTCSMWMIYSSAVHRNSPRNSARFLRESGCFRSSVRETPNLSNWPVGGAGRKAKPRVRQFLEQARCVVKAAPTRAGRNDPKNPYLPLQRDRQYIARSNPLRRGFDPPRIDPHTALGDKPGGKTPGSRHTREPQPFIEPLAQRHTFPHIIPIPQQISTGSTISSEETAFCFLARRSRRAAPCGARPC
jgi:hypothetical protein